MNEKENYIKVGFLFYIGFTIASEIDKHYREKTITYLKNKLTTIFNKKEV